MPIYAYKCSSCGFAKDVLQKISDPQLSDCPACGQAAFEKQVTAAGFQLKGSGWYVTDFRGGKAESSPNADAGSTSKSDNATAASEPAAAAPASAPVPTAPVTTSPGTSAAPAASP